VGGGMTNARMGGDGGGTHCASGGPSVSTQRSPRTPASRAGAAAGRQQSRGTREDGLPPPAAHPAAGVSLRLRLRQDQPAGIGARGLVLQPRLEHVYGLLAVDLQK
jgi:hypothetical protein